VREKASVEATMKNFTTATQAASKDLRKPAKKKLSGTGFVMVVGQILFLCQPTHPRI
jgi:hypothetical protein